MTVAIVAGAAVFEVLLALLVARALRSLSRLYPRTQTNDAGATSPEAAPTPFATGG